MREFQEDMSQVNYNRIFIPWHKYSDWLGILFLDLQCLSTVNVCRYMDRDDVVADGQESRREDQTARPPVLCQGAVSMKLPELRAQHLNMSMDELIDENTRNEEMVEEKIEKIQAYLNRFDTEYFNMLRNYINHFLPLYHDVTSMIRIQNNSEEEFEALKKNYIEYQSAILLLHNYVEASEIEEKEEEYQYEEDDNDDDDDDDDEEEEEDWEDYSAWEAEPSDSEEDEEESLPAPAVQDTKLLMKQFSQQEIDKLGDGHKCCICIEYFAANVTLLQCPGCHQYHHEHCILPHLIRHSDCPLCRHGLLKE